MTPRQKHLLKLGGLVTAGVLGVLVVGAIVISQLNRTTFGPRHQAEALLSHVAAGQAGAVVQQLGAGAPEGNQGLLTDDLYRGVENRVTGYTLGQVDTSGDRATVHAMTTQQSGASNVDVTMVKRGHRYGVFDNWVPAGLGMGHVSFHVPDGVDTVTINGKSFPLAQLASEQTDSYSLPALPGSYTVAVPDQGRYLSGSQARAESTWDDRGQSASLALKLNDQFSKDVQAAIDQKVDQCLASKTADVDSSCPFRNPTYGTIKNPSWKLVSRPVVKVESTAGYDGSYSFSTTTTGKASLSYLRDDGVLTPDWKAHSDTVDISPYGSATIAGDKVQVTFQ